MKKICMILLLLFFLLPFESFAEIEEIRGDTRIETAVKLSEYGFSEAERVLLVSGYDFPDAISAIGLSKKYRAPILLTKRDHLDDAFFKEAERLGTKEVTILGGASGHRA